ncbi:MAG: hypothetical protein NVS3B5_04170 [Sphingomicrobium sp.]
MGPFHVTPAGAAVSMVHATHPDLERFPRFAKALAEGRSAELETGDAIYIPYGWYHHVKALSPLNLLVNYWWNSARRDLGSPWDAMMHGMVALRQLPASQRRSWRAMFDHLCLWPTVIPPSIYQNRLGVFLVLIVPQILRQCAERSSPLCKIWGLARAEPECLAAADFVPLRGRTVVSSLRLVGPETPFGFVVG